MGHLAGVLLVLALVLAPLKVLGLGFMFEPKARNLIQDSGDAGSLSSGGRALPFSPNGSSLLYPKEIRI